MHVVARNTPAQPGAAPRKGGMLPIEPQLAGAVRHDHQVPGRAGGVRMGRRARLRGRIRAPAVAGLGLAVVGPHLHVVGGDIRHNKRREGFGDCRQRVPARRQVMVDRVLIGGGRLLDPNLVDRRRPGRLVPPRRNGPAPAAGQRQARRRRRGVVVGDGDGEGGLRAQVVGGVGPRPRGSGSPFRAPRSRCRPRC